MFTVYPAIDLRNGQVVRLRQGDPSQQTTYSDNPVAVAKKWAGEGAAWIHVVNLDGAFGDTTTPKANQMVALLEVVWVNFHCRGHFKALVTGAISVLRCAQIGSC